MKVTIQSPRLFTCKPGRVQAEGASAATPFCYRVKVQKKSRIRKSVIELHSRITGRKIGYLADSPKNPVTASRAEARVWTELPGSRINAPEDVDRKMKHFIKTAQGAPEKGLTPAYKEIAERAWKTIVQEARKR